MRPPRAFITLELVKDSRVEKSKTIEARSWLDNAIKWWAIIARLHSGIDVVDTSGNSRTIYSGTGNVETVWDGVSAVRTYHAIGRSNAAWSSDQYCLGDKIGVAEVTYVSVDLTNRKVEAVGSLTVSQDEDVWEVGLMVNIRDGSGTGFYLYLERTVLDSAFHVPAGYTVNIKYTYQF